MSSQTKTAQINLDFSPLTLPVTEADVAAYKQYVGKGGFANGLGLEIAIGTVFGLVFGFSFIMPLVFALHGILRLGAIILIILCIPGAIFLMRLVTAHYNKTRARLFKFASRNNIKFIQKQQADYAGMIFNEGHSREVTEAYVFADSTEIGNYRYVTGSGKNRSVHDWAYVKVKLPRKLPHMVLDAKSNNIFGRFSNLTDIFDRSQTLSLEGNFNDHFTLYAPKQYEQDAFYVFTPDVMARLIDSGSGFDMEVVDDELYIYRGNRFDIGSEAELRTVLGIVDAISSELREQTDYYADEQVGDRAQNIIAAPGARLKHGVNWVAVCIVLAFLIYYTSNMLSAGSVFAAVPGFLLLAILVGSGVASIIKRIDRS